MRELPPMPDCDPSDFEVDEAFGDHNIEYWVWSGKRLVPATAEQIETIHGIEERLHLQRHEPGEGSVHQRAHSAPARVHPGSERHVASVRLLSLLRRGPRTSPRSKPA